MYVELKDINKHFNNYKASDHVSFGIEKGKLIGLLGPSGSGKTTILRMIAGLEQPDSGEIIIDGKVVNDVPASKRGIGFVFQNYALFRYMTVYDNIAFGLKVQKVDKKTIDKRVKELIELIGLKGLDKRYPSQFSGGQRQRIGIARSLAVHPKFVVCDEAVSALDVSIQSQIINLLLDLKEQNNLTYLFISHDLSVIKYISDRIGVMYLGNMMELSDTEHLFAHPYHPYTEALLSAIPTTDVDGRKETIILEGDIPSPINPPKGCKFHTRCRYCTEICKNVTPQFEEVEPGHFVACHHKLGVPEEK